MNMWEYDLSLLYRYTNNSFGHSEEAVHYLGAILYGLERGEGGGGLERCACMCTVQPEIESTVHSVFDQIRGLRASDLFNGRRRG